MDHPRMWCGAIAEWIVSGHPHWPCMNAMSTVLKTPSWGRAIEERGAQLRRCVRPVRPHSLWFATSPRTLVSISVSRNSLASS